jgi:S-adenosylmethionine:tRNA ribosyltransferase-isomerase
MKMADFDYDLPDERIAYTPAANRSDSKILVWDQTIITEGQYKDIANYIPKGHSLFFNNSKVIAARILFEKYNTEWHLLTVEPLTQLPLTWD